MRDQLPKKLILHIPTVISEDYLGRSHYSLSKKITTLFYKQKLQILLKK